jgi:plastocyanin
VSSPVVTGPVTTTYVFAGLPEGEYTFLCEVHPAMSGVLRASSAIAR